MILFDRAHATQHVSKRSPFYCKKVVHLLICIYTCNDFLSW